MEETINKEQFLAQHNRLSPLNMRATHALLARFQEEKKPLLNDRNWSLKLRIPFILWLGSLPQEKEKHARVSKKTVYKNYPETHDI